jgi:hypothetical protein
MKVDDCRWLVDGRWIVGKGKSGGERWQINKGTGQGCGAERSTQAEKARLFNQSWRFGSKKHKATDFRA